jgi:hypothetical protein
MRLLVTRRAPVRPLKTALVAADNLLPLWLAGQRPRQSLLVRCRRGGFLSVASEVVSAGSLPVWLCPLPGPLHLPPTKEGTLLLNDVATLTFADQIALYDWLCAGTGELRVISVTAASLAGLVARGEFLEGLFRRLGAVQFDLTTGECSA